MMRKSPASGFLIQDNYPPGAATAVGQAALPQIAPQVKPAWREQVSNWLSWLSVALLVVSPTMLTWMWGYSWQQHLYPFTGWHSRWDAPYAVSAASEILETVWLFALLFGAGAFATSTMSLICKPNLRALVVGALSIVCGIIVLAHIQLLLIDL